MIDLALSFQVVIWLFVLGTFLASQQASIFHPLAVYLAFHGVVFVVRPLLVHYFGFHSVWQYMGLVPGDEDFVRTLAVASIGLVAFAIPCLLLVRARPDFHSGAVPGFRQCDERALLVTSLLLLPLIAYSIHTAAGEKGGERVANGVYILTGSTGYVLDAQHMIAPLLCLWSVRTRFHWLNLAPILVYVGYRTWCGWARWTILLFFLTLVFQYCWYRRLRWLPVWTLVAAVPVVVLFNVLGRNRDMVRNYFNEGKVTLEDFSYRAGQSIAEQRRAKLDTQDFANFDYLVAVVATVPRRTGTYTYGAQYLQLFTEPIPRILWRGKPAGAPVALFNLNQYVNFTGLTYSLVGDGWCSGGWIGVIVTLGIAGVLVGFAHRCFWSRCDQIVPSLLYLTLLGISPNWFRDGGISVFKFLLWVWLPVLLLPVVSWFLAGCRVPAPPIRVRSGQPLRIVRA